MDRWLDEGLGTHAAMLSQVVSEYLDPWMQRAGLRPTHFELLSTIHSAGEGVHQAEVARRLGLTPPSLSEAVQSAVRAGFVRQEPHPEDARAKALSLTKNGREALATVLKGMEEAEQRLSEPLSEAERHQVVDALRRAISALQQSKPTDC
jgi:DNA-binding MarR family transcriptional regulator